MSDEVTFVTLRQTAQITILEQSFQIMSCCPPGSWGSLSPPKDYVPKGNYEAIGSKLKGYVVGTDKVASKKAILCAPDIFGKDSGRSKAICKFLCRWIQSLSLLKLIVSPKHSR